MIKKRKERGKLNRRSRKKAPPKPSAGPLWYSLRDTAPQWIEIAGEAILRAGQTLRTPVRVGMVSVDSGVPGLLEVAADGEVLERAFVNGAFEERMVELEICDLVFRTRVKSLDKTSGALFLLAEPFFRGLARLLAARSRPPFLSPARARG